MRIFIFGSSEISPGAEAQPATTANAGVVLPFRYTFIAKVGLLALALKTRGFAMLGHSQQGRKASR
jgi:hypothetical protein